MRVVIAPDSFKESLSALDAARAIEAGMREVFPDWTYATMPVADGGEGTVDALVAATAGRLVTQTVSDPLGRPVTAFFGVTGDGKTAIIEIAAAAGLMLLTPDERDPLRTSSFGVGQLIRAALDTGARHLIIGLGGSATNDGGAGMAQALGARLLDRHGQALAPGGGALTSLARLDLSAMDPRIATCIIDVACDVDNPLVGPQGASAIFGPQKGASPQMVGLLDEGLRHYAEMIEQTLGIAMADRAGAGAAGGLGGALMALCGARLRSGIVVVTEVVGLDAAIAAADLVITGEGRIDGQTLHGKTPIGVARIARRHGKPVIALAGMIGEGAEQLAPHAIDAMFSVVQGPCSLDQALADAAGNLRATARNMAATLRVGLGLASLD
ncbi:MAG: glycerate kinase [Sphingomonadales bacterium]|nr:glycerate kinase [Sphingomonadales bacterium]MDE2168920.1 glycerate kinase [Sphingomonadales bacterium]